MSGYDSDPFVKLRKKIFGEDKKKAIESSADAENTTGASADVGMKKGGKVSSASARADGCCVKGKTKGKMV